MPFLSPRCSSEVDPTASRESSTPFHLTPYPKSKYTVPGTTPDALHVQKVMAGFADRGATTCVMECSSIGLDQGRCDFVDFDIAVHTNLTRDHLDYHDSMDSYLDAKLRLFRMLRDPERQRAVINLDDAYAQQFAAAAEQVPIVTYSLRDRDADVYAEKVNRSIFETEAIIRTPVGKLRVITPLLGNTNVSNILAAVAVGVSVGAPLKSIVAGIEAVEVIPGRCELIDEKQDFAVVVDYAHTPDALSRLLDTIRDCGPK